MKKVAAYILVMIFAVLVLPLIIVKGCNFSKEALIPDEDTGEELVVRVFLAEENEIVDMDIEEYTKGVVAAEMPAEFELEALKAQAVAARTFTYARMNGMFLPADNPHKDADVCTDHTHCQAYITKEQAMLEWGSKGQEYWDKIEAAVNSTHNIIITYNNQIVNPVFHSNSGGRTENVEEVWVCDPFPYLKSVESYGEENGENFYNYLVISDEEFKNTLVERYPGIIIGNNDILTYIKTLEFSQGGRVKYIRIGNITMKGTEFRDLFSLKSTNFQIERKDNNSIRITTIGYGHGVGMSQWGADYMAEEGSTFEEILKHYYIGTLLNVISK